MEQKKLNIDFRSGTWKGYCESSLVVNYVD